MSQRSKSRWLVQVPDAQGDFTAVETFTSVSAAKAMHLARQRNSSAAERASYSRDLIKEGREFGRYIIGKRLAK